MVKLILKSPYIKSTGGASGSTGAAIGSGTIVNCNRLRITSDGMLKPCLLRTGNEVSVKGKHGDELIEAIGKAVSNRSPYFTEETK